MTSQLEITPEAERDIFAIAANIKIQDSLASAKKVVAGLTKQLRMLTKNADSGRAGACEGTREVVMEGMPYIIVYEKKDASITVVRVLYGAEERAVLKNL